MNRFLFWAVTILVLLGCGVSWLHGKPQSQSNRPQSISAETQDLSTTHMPAESSPLQAAGASPTVGIVTVSPSPIPAQTPTPVTVTAQITDPTVISGSVNLTELNGAAANPTVLGQLHDDGRNGDLAANDGIYTLVYTFTQPTTTPFQLQVSAAFKGQLKRIASNAVTINVLPPPGLTQYSMPAGGTLLYPSGSQIVQEGSSTTAFFAPGFPDLPPTVEIETFTPTLNSALSVQDNLVNIAKQRLGADYVGVDHFTTQGVVVKASNLYVLYYYTYSQQKNIALELRSGSPDFFSTQLFLQVSNSVAF